MRGRGSTFGGRRTPQPPTNPPEQKPTDSEHAIDVEPSGVDVDAFGKEEAESVEGEPLVAIQEYYPCNRDGCDAGMTRRLLFTTETLSYEEKRRLDRHSGVNSVPEYVYEQCKQDGHESIVVDMPTDNISITAERVDEDRDSGPCYGYEDAATRLGI